MKFSKSFPLFILIAIASAGQASADYLECESEHPQGWDRADASFHMMIDNPDNGSSLYFVADGWEDAGITGIPLFKLEKEWDTEVYPRIATKGFGTVYEVKSKTSDEFSAMITCKSDLDCSGDVSLNYGKIEKTYRVYCFIGEGEFYDN